MGLLTRGKPLTWNEAKTYADYVRDNGIEQFLNIHENFVNKKNYALKWGEEIEYYIVKLDPVNQTAKLSLNASKYLEVLQEEENNALPDTVLDSLWRPEYGRFMIEGTPGFPYNHMIETLAEVEQNMTNRRKIVNSVLGKDEIAVTLTNFFRLGCDDCTDPPCKPYGPVAKSLFIADEYINPHPRFAALTQSIRERRGSRVDISVPLYKDSQVADPFIEKYPNNDGEATPHPDQIYMDAMCFGMGCSCLQVTFQSFNLGEARYLYDQLNVVTPILLSLSASCPIFRGLLADVDCRWNVIAQSVDDRTPKEKERIRKSRYDSIDSYISDHPNFSKEYNDIEVVINEKYYKRLKEAGIDDQLAKHVAHLFIRDPLVIYQENLEQDNATESDHFENIQSTNWQTMRFKPPPPLSNIGWRVEFRSMDVQVSDFENAAYSVFVVLLSRVILSFDLNLYIPISKVDKNIQRAQKRNSVLEQKFHFRHSVAKKNIRSRDSRVGIPDMSESREMSINEIINGSASFPGLIPMIEKYLNYIKVDYSVRCKLSNYLALISKRASGELPTMATYIRRFVHAHKDYKKDSVVSEGINYDLVKEMIDITEGADRPQLFAGLKKTHGC